MNNLCYDRANENAPTDVLASSERGPFITTIKEQMNRRWELYHKRLASVVSVNGRSRMSITIRLRAQSQNSHIIADFAPSLRRVKRQTVAKLRGNAFAVQASLTEKHSVLRAWLNRSLKQRFTQSATLPLDYVRDALGLVIKMLPYVISAWKSGRQVVLRYMLDDWATDCARTAVRIAQRTVSAGVLRVEPRASASAKAIEMKCLAPMATSALAAVRMSQDFLPSITSTMTERKSVNVEGEEIARRSIFASRMRDSLTAINFSVTTATALKVFMENVPTRRTMSINSNLTSSVLTVQYHVV